MFKSSCLLFIMVFLSLNAFSGEKIENLPREKSNSLGKWEVVSGLTTVGKKRTYRRRALDKTRPTFALVSREESQVVYNPNRRAVGIVNGTLIVNLVNLNDERDLLKDFPLRKIRLEKKIKIGIYQVDAGEDINQIVENLKNDPRVRSVEVEVVSKNGGLKPQ